MALFQEIYQSIFWLGPVEFQLHNKSHLELEDSSVISNNTDPITQKKRFHSLLESSVHHKLLNSLFPELLKQNSVCFKGKALILLKFTLSRTFHSYICQITEK